MRGVRKLSVRWPCCGRRAAWAVRDRPHMIPWLATHAERKRRYIEPSATGRPAYVFTCHGCGGLSFERSARELWERIGAAMREGRREIQL